MLFVDTINRFKKFVDETALVTLEKYHKYLNGEADHVVYEKAKCETAFSVLSFLVYWEALKGRGDDIIIQTPSDHFINDYADFENVIHEAVHHAKNGWVSMVGVNPEGPETGFGYIKDGCSMVEKPDKETAARLIKDGYIWNTAIYAYRAMDMLQYYMKLFTGDKISFEKTILQRVDRLKVIKGHFGWKDLGSHERLKETVRG